MRRPLLPMIKLAPSPYKHERESADGIWHYQRIESPGTPWVVTHIETERWLYLPSLPVARRLTCSGWALEELDRTQPLAVVGAT